MSFQDPASAARTSIVETARALLDGQIGVLEAARRIASLRLDADPNQEDPDLLAFAGIESQTDELLIGDAVQGWHPDVRDEKVREIAEADAFFRPGALASASALLARYGRPA
jgi:hypothetical protein